MTVRHLERPLIYDGINPPTMEPLGCGCDAWARTSWEHPDQHHPRCPKHGATMCGAPVTDDLLIALALRRLIAGRELLGYELAHERGLGDDATHNARLRAYHDERAKLRVDPLRMREALRAVLGTEPDVDVVALCAGVTEREVMDAGDAAP